MNDTRRKLIAEAFLKLEEALGMIEQAAEEEREYFDNMPENMQSGEKGTKADEDADALQNIHDEIQSAAEQLNEVIGEA
jgi:flagellar biosynthesis chaperone FliJ